MRFTSAFLIIAGLSLTTAYIYPEHIPLYRRQAPGTPAYDCHANCGAVIQIARTENYCTSTNFTTQLTACLNCANQFDIWQYYGESVEEAEQACGITAGPVAVNATTSAVVAVGTVTSGASATEPAEGPTSGTQAATSEVSESFSRATSGSGSGSVTATPAGSANAGATAETSAAAGVKNVLGCGMAMLPIGVAALAFP